jgi:23S rRNA pseudouridine2605 synthase
VRIAHVLHPKVRPFMPRDNDKDNDSHGRREGGKGGKGRSGRPRGPEKKFAKRGFAGKHDREKSPHRGNHDGRPFRRRDEDEAPRREFGDTRAPKHFHRGDRPRGDRPSRFREDHASRGRDRKSDSWDRKGDPGDRNSRAGDRNSGARERGDARSAGRFEDRKFRDRREDRNFGGRDHTRGRGRDYTPDQRERERGARDRGDTKPWQKREARAHNDRGRDERPRFARGGEDRPKFERPRRDRNRNPGDRNRDPGDRKEDRGHRKDDPGHRGDRRPRFEGRSDWQEHPRSDRRSERFADRPRRHNEDDGKVFAKRPAFGGRAAYRERTPDDRRPPPPPQKKSGERIAKVLARAGLASRRDAEEMVTQGRVTVNGRVINSPALDVTLNDVVTVDGQQLPPRERTRLFLYHKPRGLMTTHADPEGRPTVFDNLPEGLPRLISVGRLDFNTEGLLLLTNDGGLARALELPETGWLRRYRVRAHGEVTQAQLDELKRGVDVDAVKYGPIDATLEHDQGANVWLVFAIREGKNREVRNVMAHLGLEVNRLIRISYGPFQLAELAEGEVEEVKTRVLREQLGEKITTLAGADFSRPEQRDQGGEEADAPGGKKPFKPSGKNALVADRKGRRVLVQRTGGEEARARNELEANGYGPPRRPKRGYHGKRDFRPLDE